MAPFTKLIDTLLDDPSSIPRSHMVRERTKSCKWFSDFTQVLWDALCTHKREMKYNDMF